MEGELLERDGGATAKATVSGKEFIVWYDAGCIDHSVSSI